MRQSKTAAIALGSNLGDRRDHLRQGLARLADLHQASSPIKVSRVYETLPVDCPQGSPPFLNAAVVLETPLSPLDLLAELQYIETLLGRPRIHPRNAPRTLDLDLLFLGHEKHLSPTLTLPHPRITERCFVLAPLCDICPDFILPDHKYSLREFLERNPRDDEFLNIFPIE